jgi:hypothetical protein
MQIGILTFHNADNYGAVLQCYALQEKLKELHPNDEVFVIDYKCPKIVNSYIPRLNFKKPWKIFTLSKTKKKVKTFQKFREKYLNLGTDDFSFYDVIYYGSDQIWNPSLTGNDLKYFGKNYSGKKIAYAASDGGEMNYDTEVCDLLNQFSKISCREKTLTEKLQNLDIKSPIKTVCDPVFLLSKEQWLKIAELPKDDNYVLAYKISANPNFDNEAEKLGQRLGKKVIQIVYVKSLRKFFYHGQSFVEGISPEKFVGYFAKADFVLTTSFHGTAFSVIFDKPFFVLSFNKRSERITDLLSALGIQDRYGSVFQENKNKIQGLEEYKDKGVEVL